MEHGNYDVDVYLVVYNNGIIYHDGVNYSESIFNHSAIPGIQPSTGRDFFS